MSTSHSRQDHGSRLPPRTVHATTRGRTRVKNDKLRTSIQDLMVSPLFASLKKNGKAKRLSCSYSWTFATCPPTCGRALMRARKNVPPEIRLTEPRMPTAASNAREQKKTKPWVLEIHWDSPCSSSHKLWSSGGGQRHARIAKTRRIFSL